MFIHHNHDISLKFVFQAPHTEIGGHPRKARSSVDVAYREHHPDIKRIIIKIRECDTPTADFIWMNRFLRSLGKIRDLRGVFLEISHYLNHEITYRPYTTPPCLLTKLTFSETRTLRKMTCRTVSERYADTTNPYLWIMDYLYYFLWEAGTEECLWVENLIKREL